MGLNRLDFAIIALYLAGITLFGLRFRKKQRTLRDYFLAGRDIPWWAIALSIVAAETSTLTIISIPGLAYDTNLTFLQVVMGYVVGRVVISFVLLPHYFRGDLYTAYELIERRFGRSLRSLTAGLFLLTRAAAEGVRVYAVSIVVSIALGTGEVASIAIITALTLIYTFEGGLAAVIWTDVVQTVIYVGGTLVGLVTITASCARRLERNSSGCARRGKVSGIRFSTEHLAAVHVLGGRHRRDIPDYSQPRHRPAHCSAPARRAGAETVGNRLALQWHCYLISVRAVPDRGRDAVGVIIISLPPRFGKADRIYPTFIVSPHAAWHLRFADCGNSGGRHVESQCCAEFAILQRHHGFLCRLRPQSDEKNEDATLPPGNAGVGSCPVWVGSDRPA